MAPAAVRPAAGPVAPRPVSPGGPVVSHGHVPVGPRPSGPPSPSAGPPRPGGRPPFGGGGERRGPPRPRGPVTPPTPEAINALAKREHVPARIAKGELEGKMKARVWRKLHKEEAGRFDQVYQLMDANPGLDLADAFGALQSGLTPAEFLARKARTQKKAQVKEARGSVAADAVNQFVEALLQQKTELSVVLAERTLLDVLTKVEPVAFNFEKAGRVEKLQVVVMARRASWERMSASLERDSKLAQKPAAVVRQPEKRPVSDPRPFVDLVGRTLDLTLRNGLRLVLPLLGTGPFDLLLGAGEDALFVPLHAILKWQTEGGPPQVSTEPPAS